MEPREIGSDFEPVKRDLLAGPVPPPWVGDEPITYVESGRQALSLVARHLRAQGRRRVLFPAHYCDSMLEPFLADGWDAAAYELDALLRPVPESVLRLLGSQDQDALLFAPYFGVPEATEVAELISSVERKGVPLIVDESHAFLEPTRHNGRIRVASLRKLLPIADGAFVTGLLGAVSPGPGTRASNIRRRAMTMKADFLAGRSRNAQHHLELFQRAEYLTELQTEPAAQSEQSTQLLEQLDYQQLRSRRRENMAAFLGAFASKSFQPLHGFHSGTPSHVVMHGSDVQGLRRHLISHRIYCPIHWPEPRSMFAGTREWRTDLLSVPIDHRYGVVDMHRIVAAIGAYEVPSPSPTPRSTR